MAELTNDIPGKNVQDAGDSSSNMSKLLIGILIIAVLVIGFNAYQLSSFSGSKANSVTGSATLSTTVVNSQPSPAIDVTPKGIPAIYGTELGVSYGDVSAADPKKADATISKIGALDDQISLNAEQMTRYISIASKIGCEYCCGAESIIFSNGQAACGCAHSYAMRGLAKYLIKNHNGEYTDDQILEELGKWKTLFFPGEIAKKAAILKEKGIELNYINLASNKYRNL